MLIVVITIVCATDLPRQLDLSVEQDPQLLGGSALLEEEVPFGKGDLPSGGDQLGELTVGERAREGRAAEVVGERHTVSR